MQNLAWFGSLRNLARKSSETSRFVRNFRSIRSFQHSLNSAQSFSAFVGFARKVGRRSPTGILLGISFISSTPASSKSKSKLEMAVIEADVLYDQLNFKDIYSLLLPLKDSKDPELLWRLSRATYELSQAATDAGEKEKKLREALSYVKEGLAVDENNFAIHKWMAILVDKVGQLDGLKARITESFKVRHHMEKACELKPTDGTSWHILGLWHYNVSEVPWYQRKVASVIFASPPSSTYEEALKIFLRAEELEPNFYSQNLLYIGLCYKNMGKKEEAKEYLKKTYEFSPRRTADDDDAFKQAEKLLKELGVKL